jgi:hypothetical protein
MNMAPFVDSADFYYTKYSKLRQVKNSPMKSQKICRASQFSGSNTRKSTVPPAIKREIRLFRHLNHVESRQSDSFCWTLLLHA